MKLPAIFKNKILLNVLVVLSLLNLFGYLTMGDLEAVLLFIVMGVLVHAFSKNMIVVLGTSLIFVSIYRLKNRMVEGMENANTAEDASASQIPSGSVVKAKIASKALATQKGGGEKTSQGLNMEPIKEENDQPTIKEGKAGFEAGRKKSRGHQIDYATTIEDAYDELNSILGSEGIQRLTSDTQHLMKQQMQLAEALKSMGPMMESLAPMVENLKGMMGDSKMNMSGIADLAKSITNTQK